LRIPSSFNDKGKGGGGKKAIEFGVTKERRKRGPFGQKKEIRCWVAIKTHIVSIEGGKKVPSSCIDREREGRKEGGRGWSFTIKKGLRIGKDGNMFFSGGRKKKRRSHEPLSAPMVRRESLSTGETVAWGCLRSREKKN